MRHVTPKHETFAELYAKTGDARYSAQRAGFSSDRGYVLAKDVTLRSMIEAKRLADDIYVAAAPLVAAEHVKRLLDPETSNREFAALVAPFNKRSALIDAALGGKQPHEMTPEELAAAITKLEEMASERAKPVEQSSVFA